MEGTRHPLVKILLVEDDLGDVRLIDRTLKREYPGAYEITHVSSVSETLSTLVSQHSEFDIILLDLNLSDSSGLQGMSVISKITRNAIPVIILSGIDDETMAEQAMHFDAQDYMSKQTMTGAGLNRMIRYAIERHKTRVALEENRERFRQFARVASDRFWEMDKDFKFTDAAGTLTDDQKPSKGTLVGRARWEVPGYEPLNDANWDAHKAVLEKHESFRHFEVVYVDDSGDRTYWSISGEPVMKDDETFLGYRGTAANITERKRAEEELATAKEALEETNTRKDKFFSIIAHDLRSPFSGVMGTADLFRKGIIKSDPEKLKEYGELMYAASVRAFNLVEDLLEWSRLQLSGVSFNAEVFPISALIDENLELVKTNAVQKNVQVANVSNEVVSVLADRQAINAVLRNLITNALKFTAEDGQITVDVKKIGQIAEVTVTDTGVGIPEEKIDRLFSIAEETSTVGTSGERGTGLGLVLCKELLDKNGGTIRVDSTIGEGTTIRFTVPMG